MFQEILIFIYEGFAEFEITPLSWQISEHKDFHISTMAYDLNPLLSSSGFTFIPDKKVSDVSSLKEVAALVIPGGSLLDLRASLIDLLQLCAKNDILIAAICAGPQYLAASGILDDIKFTTSRTHERYLELQQEDPFKWENFEETRIVYEHNILTAKGYAYNDFALKIWEILKLVSVHELNEWKLKLNIP